MASGYIYMNVLGRLRDDRDDLLVLKVGRAASHRLANRMYVEFNAAHDLALEPGWWYAGTKGGNPEKCKQNQDGTPVSTATWEKSFTDYLEVVPYLKVDDDVDDENTVRDIWIEHAKGTPFPKDLALKWLGLPSGKFPDEVGTIAGQLGGTKELVVVPRSAVKTARREAKRLGKKKWNVEALLKSLEGFRPRATEAVPEDWSTFVFSPKQMALLELMELFQRLRVWVLSKETFRTKAATLIALFCDGNVKSFELLCQKLGPLDRSMQPTIKSADISDDLLMVLAANPFVPGANRTRLYQDALRSLSDGKLIKPSVIDYMLRHVIVKTRGCVLRAELFDDDEEIAEENQRNAMLPTDETIFLPLLYASQWILLTFKHQEPTTTVTVYNSFQTYSPAKKKKKMAVVKLWIQAQWKGVTKVEATDGKCAQDQLPSSNNCGLYVMNNAARTLGDSAVRTRESVLKLLKAAASHRSG